MNSIGRQSCERIIEEKTPLSHEVVCFQMLEFETLVEVLNSIQIFKWNITFFLKNYISQKLRQTQRELFLTMFYTMYQQLSIARRYQVSFYAINYFE